MEARLRADGPLDVSQTLARFRLWGDDPANRLTADSVFRRAVKVGGRWWGWALTWAGGPDDVVLTVSVPGARRAAIVDAAIEEARGICGLDLDVSGFYRAAKADPALGGLAPRLYGLRPTLTPRPFEMLVGAVSAQQVNLRFAYSVRARLVQRYGTPVRAAGATVYGFPEPEALAGTRVGELRRLQFTTRKSEYIVGLARLVVAGALDLDGLRGRSNGEVIETLTAVRGFGRWTAEWFLARALGRGDVCPAGDLAVRKAFEHFYNHGRPLTERAIRRRAARWGEHQSLAVHYLLAGQRLATATTGGGT